LGGKELAQFVGKSADKEIEDIERLFDYRTNGRLQFMIFNRYSDLKQTNPWNFSLTILRSAVFCKHCTMWGWTM
jgi:hypothetical protein